METGEPIDKLSNGAKAWCQEQGSSATTVSEIMNGPDEKVQQKASNGGLPIQKICQIVILY